MRQIDNMNTLTLNNLNLFEYWWNISTEWVEEPNQRRGGVSGVLRLRDETGQVFYIKRQAKHIYRSLLYPFGQATIKREYQAYRAFQKAGVTVPEIVYYSKIADRAILVTKELSHFVSFEEWLNQINNSRTSEANVLFVLASIAKNLATLHRNRLQHNCIYPKHIFIKTEQVIASSEDVQVALLDLEKSRKRLTAKQAALHDIPQIKRHTALTNNEWQYFVQQYEQAFGKFMPSLYTV